MTLSQFPWIPVALSLAALALGVAVLRARAQDAPRTPPTVDRTTREVHISATLHPDAFLRADPAHHHLIAWAGGRAGPKALLVTPTADVDVLDALESLGASPGDNLTPEAWTERADPAHPDPDVHALGTPLLVELLLPDGRRPVQDLLVDTDANGFAWVLAGNRALIPVWRSGCVVCLQSCPGSKVSNARTTMRDLHHDRTRFELSPLAHDLGPDAQLTVAFRPAD